MKILPERLVFDVVPAGADTEPQPAARQHIDTSGLFRDESGLPLRQDEDRGHQFQGLRQARQIAVENEWLKELALRRIRAIPIGAARRVGAQNMIVDDDMIVADVLGGGRETGDILRVSADLRLRKYNA